MISRRRLLLCGLALPTVARAAAAEAPTIRLGVLPFGTVSWEVAAIRSLGLEEAGGFRLETVKLATNDAARVAFLAGGVDVIVSDLLLAARLRNEGRKVKFMPYSTTEGGLMVPAGSPIGSVADLAGKRLGVAGGALDKTWLLLKAHAQEAAGLDLASAAALSFGAPPLISAKLESGELDAALLFWNFCARLEAKGFRKLLGADDMARPFGLTGEIALLGYMFDEPARPALWDAFGAASRRAKAVLANDAAAWAPVRPLMEAEDDATFEALKRYFLAGTPRRPLEAERADARKLFAVLRRLGGDKLVGPGETLPDGLYWNEPGG